MIRLRVLNPLVAAVSLLFFQQSAAQAVNLIFSTPGFTYLQQGGGTPYHLWTAGDFWEQNFTGTGLPTANSLALNLSIVNDSAAASETLNFNVLLNSTNVGTFALHPSDVGAAHLYNFSFPAIAGQNYDIKMVATNTISSGHGSYSLALDGNSYATLIPEPASWGLVAIATAGALVRLRRYKTFQPSRA